MYHASDLASYLLSPMMGQLPQSDRSVGISSAHIGAAFDIETTRCGPQR